MDFRTTTVVGLAGDVAAGRTSARSLTEGALARIDELDPKVNAFVAVDADAAVARPTRSMRGWPRGRRSVRWLAFRSA